MNALRTLFLSILCLLLPAQALEPHQVVVVFNAESELSRTSAQRYAKLRRIPSEHLIGLQGLRYGHISRADFESKIWQPLLAVGRMRGFRWPSGYSRGATKRICAMVLMPDMPLGVHGSPRPKDAPPPARMMETHASLDSELMLLGGRFPEEGALKNPCYRQEFSLGRETLPVMAVCRIDGPDAASINRMIDDPARVEQQGLRGWTVIDHRGTKGQDGDGWLATAARQARSAGHPLFYETSPQTLATAFPLMTDTAVYLGWYAHPTNGPFSPTSSGDFRFAPGAVAVHIHSNSASSLKDPRYWVAGLVKRGAAVTAGNVFEPYLWPTLHLDVFHERLLKGSCVAEAALMATPVLSWQNIVMGDPLYRPFAAETRRSEGNAYTEWRHLRLDSGDDLRSLSRSLRTRLSSPQGAALAEMFAWHCTELREWSYAIEFFTAACGRYTTLRDRTRTLIMAASTMAADGQKERALHELRRWIDAGEHSPYLPALKASYAAMGGKPEETPPAT